MDKLKDASTLMLQCGHPSCGTKYEDKSLPCLFPECEKIEKAKGNLKYQNGEDFCNICFIEGLI